MSRKVLVLDAAKPDFREIRKYVKSEVNEEFKATLTSIGLHPAAGTELEELRELGQGNFRTRLVRQTRIVYEYDENEVLVHMFIHTRRDFRTHLMGRLFNI